MCATERERGRTELGVSVWRDHHSRQARNDIFLPRMFPVALNRPLSQRHSESSINYNHICGGPRHEHRPPEKPGDRCSKTAPNGKRKDGGGGQIDSVVLAAGRRVLGVFQSHHPTPVGHRGRDGKQKARTQERNGSAVTSHNAPFPLRQCSSVQDAVLA